MTQVMDAVRRTVMVRAPQQRAFDVFTSGMSTWWPRGGSHSLFEEGPDAVVVEPRPGGRWFERRHDGAERDWGQVAEWDPPRRVLLLWQLDPEFDFNVDTALATEVEVRFVAESDDITRVELEHRGFEVHGDAAAGMRESVGRAGGWGELLERFGATLGGWS